MVAATVASVNVVTPGHERGRPYPPPTGPELADRLVAALGPATRDRGRPADAQLTELAEHLGRLRTVFELVEVDLDSACERVNDLLAATRAAPVLSRHDGERWHLHFHPRDATWAVRWAGAMATSLAVVLGGPSYDRLGVCSAPACDRVYVDTSRNGARRFCSTACQNRVKAAAFRERHRVGP
ncbi:MAG TPA: CGNR zinc finger domain-containing protein [Pseudonocardiaceae bacterium]|nr:CGNR zinc finger domain-containing protein [Pseudonocardiaceae bacterium]